MLYKVPNKTYELVNQRKSFDCVVACLSMFTGEDYEIIYGMLKRLGWRDDLEIGVSDRLIVALLKEFGERPVRSFQLHPVPSLVVVPSVNKRHTFHCVFYDGDETVFDPMYGKKFKNFYDKDFELGRVVAKSITVERFFETPLSHKFSHTVPWEGFDTPRDLEMEGLVARMVKNMHHWDERKKPLNQEFKWQLQEAEKVLRARGIEVDGKEIKRDKSIIPNYGTPKADDGVIRI